MVKVNRENFYTYLFLRTGLKNDLKLDELQLTSTVSLLISIIVANNERKLLSLIIGTFFRGRRLLLPSEESRIAWVNRQTVKQTVSEAVKKIKHRKSFCTFIFCHHRYSFPRNNTFRHRPVGSEQRKGEKNEIYFRGKDQRFLVSISRDRSSLTRSQRLTRKP